MLIIENFIPPEDKMKVQTRATFDEDEDMWKLAPLSKARWVEKLRENKLLLIVCFFFLIEILNFSADQMMKKPVSALNNRRPISQYAKMAAAMGGNPRYKVRFSSAIEHSKIVTR